MSTKTDAPLDPSVEQEQEVTDADGRLAEPSDPVIAYRLERLSKLGFDDETACAMANRRTDRFPEDDLFPGIDLHDVARLLNAGCPLELVWEIRS